jgi:hypothetical protein
MTYTIIGGDGKQYPLISAEDIRKWIAENRLNAQSLVKADTDADFRPLSSFTEFADAFGGHASAPDMASAAGGSGDWATRDYELDIGGCVSRGWNLFKGDIGILWGGFIVGGLIIIVASGIVGGISGLLIPKAMLGTPAFQICYKLAMQAILALVNGPVFGGIFYVFIQRLRGRPAGIGEIFIGFQRFFTQLFLGNFVVALLASLCFIPATIEYTLKVMPIMDQFQHVTPDQMQGVIAQLKTAMIGIAPIMMICMVPALYLTVNLQFVLPLIVDKQIDFWDAVKISWKKVHKHWFSVFGFVVVISLINVAGLCACCIGLIFTVPLTIAMTMCVYETIFGEPKTT